jgi:hypothetical protein
VVAAGGGPAGGLAQALGPHEDAVAVARGRCELSPASPASFLGLIYRSELEERIALSRGRVLLDRVIDAEPDLQEDADGWPKVWPNQRTEDARPPEPLECAPQYSSRFLG